MSGRRTTKTREQREEDLRLAVRRSGFSEPEVFRILYRWYGSPQPEQDTLNRVAVRLANEKEK